LEAGAITRLTMSAQHQVAIAPARRSATALAQQLWQADLLRRPENSGDVTMR
jgi:hypothetical protein